MEPGPRRMLDGLPGAVDIGFVGAGQACDLRFFDDPCDLANRVKVTRKLSENPPRNIHAQLFELPGQQQFFLRVHAVAR